MELVVCNDGTNAALSVGKDTISELCGQEVCLATGGCLALLKSVRSIVHRDARTYLSHSSG